MTLNEEKALKAYFKHLVREAMFDMGYMQENDIDEKKHHKSHGDETVKKTKKKVKKNRSKAEMAQKRHIVISALDTERDGQGEIKLDVAPYAYALWPDKDKDSARSYFYKCLKGELNDSGVPYEFDDSEINRLYSMLSNNAM